MPDVDGGGTALVGYIATGFASSSDLSRRQAYYINHPTIVAVTQALPQWLFLAVG
jgi:hypothetical protein